MSIVFANGGHSINQRLQLPQPVRGSNPVLDIGRMLVDELQRVGWVVKDLDLGFTTVPCDGEPVRKLHRIEGSTPDGPYRIVFNRGVASDDAVRPYIGEVAMPPGILVAIGHGPHGAYFGREDYRGSDWKRDGIAFYCRNGVTLQQVRDPLKTELELKIFLLQLAIELRSLPAAPGHDDLTDEGDANLRRLCDVGRSLSASPLLQ